MAVNKYQYADFLSKVQQAKEVDNRNAVKAFDESKGNDAAYYQLRGNKNLAVEADSHTFANEMMKAPDYSDLWQNQSFLDMSSPFLSNVMQTVNEARKIPKPAEEVDRNMFQTFYDKAVKSYLTSIRGQAVARGDERSEMQILKQLEAYPDFETEGIAQSIAGGLGELGGSMSSSAYEIARNQGLYYGVAGLMNVIPHPATQIIGKAMLAGKKGRMMNQAVVAQAVFEDTQSSMYGNEIRKIQEANPDMDVEEVEKRAMAVSVIGAAVEAIPFGLGVPQSVAKSFTGIISNMVAKGTIAPAVASHPTFVRKAVGALKLMASGAGKAAGVTALELSEEKIQDLVSEAASTIEGNMDNPYLTLGQYGLTNFAEDVANLANPLEEMSARNREFLGNTEDIRNAMFFTSMLGFSLKSWSSRYSDGTKVEETAYQQNMEDVESAAQDNATMVNQLKKLREHNRHTPLNEQAPQAKEMLNEEISKHVTISMEANEFVESVETVLQDESLADNERQAIEEIFNSMKGDVEAAISNGSKVDIPYSAWAGIFEVNDEAFNQSLELVSNGQGGLSKKQMADAVKAQFAEKNVEVYEQMEDDYVYNNVLEVVADDALINDDQKQDIAATIQIGTSMLASMTGRTPRQLWTEAGVRFKVAQERMIEGRSSFRKALDRFKGADPTIKDPTQALVSELAAKNRRRELIKSTKEVRALLKKGKAKVGNAELKREFGAKPMTVLDVVKKVGGISSGLTESETNNLKDLARKSRGRTRLSDYYPTEIVNAMGMELARKHLKPKSVGKGLDDLGAALKEEGFFPNVSDNQEITNDMVIELLEDVNQYNPDVQSYIEWREKENQDILDQFEIFGISEKSSDSEIQDYIDRQMALFDEVRDDPFDGGEPIEVYDDIPFFQDKRGSFSSSSNLIEIAKYGDATTYMHEFFHFYLSELEKSVSVRGVWEQSGAEGDMPVGAANDQAVKMYESMREWSGAVEGSMNSEANRNANEKLASGFERYLAEGRAPVSNLNAVFARMKSIFMSIYKHLKKVGVPINNKIRDAYDGMFASYEDIKKAKKSNGVNMIKKPIETSDAFYEAYLEDQAQGNANASHKVMAQRMKDAERLKTKEMKKRRADIRKDVEAIVNENPMFDAYDEAMSEKINIASLEREGIDKMMLKSNMKSSKGGIDIQVMAETYGYKNVYEFVEQLATTVDREVAIEFETEKMLQQEISMEPARETPIKAVTDRKFFSATIRKAIMFGGKPETEFEMIKETVIQSATDGFLNETVSKAVNLNRWRNVLRKNSDQATQAFNTGDQQTAYRHGIYSAIAQLQSEFSVLAEKNYRKVMKRVASVKGTKESRASFGQENYDFIASLINAFEMKSSNLPVDTKKSIGEQLDSFIDRMKVEVGLEDLEQLRAFKPFIEKPKNFKAMSYSDFIIFSDFLSGVMKTAKQSRLIQMEGLEIDAQKAVIDMLKDPVKIKMNEDSSGVKEALAKMYTKLVSIPTLMYDTLGDKFVKEYLLPFKEGHSRAMVMQNQKVEAYSKIMQKHGVSFDNKKVRVDEIGYSVSKNMLFSWALNLVSDTNNRQNLYKSIAMQLAGVESLTAAQIDAVHRAIPANYYAAANDVVQDIFGDIYAPLRDAVQKRAGFAIERVEGSEFKTPYGQTFKGGYFPLDRKPKSAKEIDARLDPMKVGIDMFPAYSMGNTKKRLGVVKGDLKMDSNVVMKSIYNSALQIHVIDKYNNIARVFKYRNQMEKHIGDYAYKQMNKWLEESIQQPQLQPKLSAIDGAMKAFILGFRATTVLIQPLGLIPAASVVGSQWVVPNIAKFVANPQNMWRAVDKASKKSNYMHDRFINSSSVIFGILESSPVIKTKVREAGDKVRDFMTYGIAYMDAAVSTITWNAQYEKSISEGKPESEAILLADEMVRQTQGDFSQYAKPELLKGMLGVLTPFMTYFTAIGSKMFSSLVKGDRAQFYGLAFATIVLSPVLESFMREFLATMWSDDEEEPYLERVANRIPMTMAQTLGTTVMPVANIGGSAPNILWNGYAYTNELLVVQAAFSAIEGVRSAGILGARAVGAEEGFREMLEAGGVDVKEKDSTKDLSFDIMEGIGSMTGWIPKRLIDNLEQLLEEK